MNLTSKTILIFSTLCLLMVANHVRADRALIIAEDEYPTLTNADLENAGKNSAPRIARLLETYQFSSANVTTLINARATKADILRELDNACRLITPGERFVFYFFGHGGKAFNKPVLLPYDARMDSGTNDLDRDTLGAKLKAIALKGCPTTCLLDSCSSEGMITTAHRLETASARKALYFHRPKLNGRLENFVEVNEQADNNDGGVCYFVASKSQEQAYADEIEGKMVGLFTYSLDKHLVKSAPWGDIHRAVSTRVSKLSEDLQHPVLSEGYQDKLPFGKGAAPHPKPVDSIESLMNTDNENRTVFNLRMDLNKARLAVGEQFRYTASSSKSGYLLVLTRNSEGKIEVLFPSKKDSSITGITASVPRQLPRWYCDRTGTEHAKAFLFNSKEKLEAVLDMFKSTAPIFSEGAGKYSPGSGVRAGDIKPVEDIDVNEFYTISITLEIYQIKL